MLGVGQKFPSFSLDATVSTDKKNAFQTITDQDFKGKWKVYFFASSEEFVGKLRVTAQAG